MSEEMNQSFDWKLRIQESLHDILQRFLEYTPQIIGAALLMLLGLIVATLLKITTSKLLSTLNSFIGRVPKLQSEARLRIRSSYTNIAGKIVFWTTLALFFSASASLLGWTIVTEWLDSIVAFLPSFISGLLIVLAGLFAGSLARSAASATAARYQVKRSDSLGRLAQTIVVFGFAVVGIEQIGLNLHFLTNVFVVVIGILLAGAALAFGLGAKDLVANIVGIQRIRKHCGIGERLSIGEIEGEIIEFSQTSVILDAEDGTIIVPAKLFQERMSRILSESESAQAAEEGASNG